MINYYLGHYHESSEGLGRIFHICAQAGERDHQARLTLVKVVRFLGLSKCREGKYGAALKLFHDTYEIEGMEAKIEAGLEFFEEDEIDVRLMLAQARTAYALACAYAGQPAKAMDHVDFSHRLTESAHLQEKEVDEKMDERVLAEKLLHLDHAQVRLMSGHYREAERTFSLYFLKIQAEFGENHALILSEHAVVNAWLFAFSGRPREGEQRIQALIAQMCDSAELGPTHPSTLQAMHALVWVFRLQGKYVDAKYTAGSLIKYSMRALGAEHVHTLRFRISFANILLVSGEWDCAERELRSLLGFCESLPDEDVSTVISDCETVLAKTLRARGRMTEALAKCQKALLRQLRHVSGNSSLLQGCGNGLEHLLQTAEIESSGDAIKIKQNSDVEGLLIVPDSSLLDTMHELALCEQSEEVCGIQLARKLLMIVLKGREKQMGMEHHTSMDVIADLAVIERLQGRFDDSRKSLQQVLRHRESVLGSNNPNTAWARFQHACALFVSGSLKAALHEHLEALKYREWMLGSAHVDTVDSQLSLAETHLATGHYDAALELLSRSLPTLDTLYGTTSDYGRAHHKILKARVLQADALSRIGDLPAADRILHEAIDDLYREFKRRGPEENVARSRLASQMSDLGSRYGRQQAKLAYETLRSELLPTDPLRPTVISNMALIAFSEQDPSHQDLDRAEQLQREAVSLVDVQATPEQEVMAHYFNLALMQHTISTPRHDIGQAENADTNIRVAIEYARKSKSPQLEELEETRRFWKDVTHSFG